MMIPPGGACGGAVAEDKTSVLVVDDSPAVRRLIAETLTTRGGYGVTEASGGMEAIAAFRKKKFPLVTLDVEMPGMAGVDVLRILKTLDPDLFCIMVSGQSSIQTALQAIRLGAYDYVGKPFDPDDLVFSVRRALMERSLIQENRGLVADLQTLNENLEGLVRERTRELAETHEELVRQHGELEVAYARLRELDLMKEKFVTIASHELITPLTIIRGFSEMLGQERMRPGRRAEVAQAMENSLDRLQSIVATITSIVGLREKKAVLTRGHFDLEPLFQQVAGELRPFTEQRRQTLLVEVPADLPPVEADPARIGQVVSNLLLNAIRFTPDGGHITISADTECEAGFVRVSVVDTGIGIDEDQIEKIFASFYEVAPTDHHRSGTFEFQSGGLGVGLWLVRDIIHEHGGRIWAESARSSGGTGSTFRFLLPKTKSD
jgi:signal transduction histidine kinase